MSVKIKENKRLNSSKEYINRLLEKHSKVNVIRVDLAYNKETSKIKTTEDVNKDLNKLYNNMRSKPSIFKDKIGHIVKKEYTEDKGMHIHGLFVFDGNKVLKDSYKAEQIGEYWKDTITKKEGIYHNCNRTKNEYENNGIGMIDYRDSEKIDKLHKNVLPYLCKEEQEIKDSNSKSKDKSFIRGVMPKKKSNRGRPRVEDVEE